MPVISCAEQSYYPKEENTGRDKDSYPYIIRTPYAAWHISKADIELLGEEKYYEGLYAILDDSEADFADARAALAGFIPDEIQPIDIYTDFCNKAEASKTADAFYRDLGREAALRLIDHIDHPNTSISVSVMIPTTLVEGESMGRAPRSA